MIKSVDMEYIFSQDHWSTRDLDGISRWLKGTAPHTHLLLCKVVLTQFLPQPPVFTEHVQGWCHLAQGDNVPAIWETVQDVVQHVQGQVTECEARVHLLKGNTMASNRREHSGFLQQEIVAMLGRHLRCDSRKEVCPLTLTAVPPTTVRGGLRGLARAASWSEAEPLGVAQLYPN